MRLNLAPLIRQSLLLFLLLITPFSVQALNAQPLKTSATHIGHDFKESVASWPILVLLGGGATAGFVYHFDHSWQNVLRDGDYLAGANDILAVAGQPYVLAPLSLLLYGAGKWTHQDRLALTGETLAESLLITTALTGVLKFAFRRGRPNGGDLGFPSAHAASSFAVATVLQTLYGPKAGIPAYLAAGLIGFSRIDSNVHYTSDVVMGAALGSAFAWGTARFHKTENRHLFFSPTMGTQTGLTATYIF